MLPHGSYLVNLAQEDKAKAKQAYDSFLDDLRRCEQLGITLYNFQLVDLDCVLRRNVLINVQSWDSKPDLTVFSHLSSCQSSDQGALRDFYRDACVGDNVWPWHHNRGLLV